MTIRYRKLDENGDYVFGKRLEDEFLIDSPEAVAQSLKTRLFLSAGEWFLDLAEGTNYVGGVLGFAPSSVRAFIFRDRIINTVGVTQITSFSENLDDQRNYSMSAFVVTLFGPVFIDYTMP